MGVTPNNLGVQYKLNNLTSSVINLGGITSSQPSKGETIGSILGGIAGIGLGVLGTAMAAKQTSSTSNEGTNATSSQLTERQTYEAKVRSLNIEIGSLNARIENAQSKCTDQSQIDAKEKEIKDAEAELNKNGITIDGENFSAEIIKQYSAAKKNFDNASLSYDNAFKQKEIADKNLETITTQIESLDQNSEDPDVQTSLKTLKKQESDAELKQKAAEEELRKQEALKNQAKQELDNIKGIKDDNTNQQARNDKFTNIDAQLESLNNKKNELKQMKSTMEANKKLLEGLNTALLAKQDELVGYQAILDQLITEETLAKEAPKSKIKKTASDLGEKYQNADKADGNWLSRAWTGFKGIFSKNAREDYKEMIGAHRAKDEIINQMETAGGSKSDLNNWIDNNNAQTKANEFIKDNSQYANKKDIITKYYNDHPRASDEQIKSYLDHM